MSRLEHVRLDKHLQFHSRAVPSVSRSRPCYLQFARYNFTSLPQAGVTSLADFTARRRYLFSCMPPNTLLIILASDEVSYSKDILYRHRQNSIFYHLFGLQESLRRMLSPPTLTSTSNIRLTCAAFMKTDASLRTFLFVPPKTTEPLELVWGSQPRTLEDFKKRHLGLCTETNQADTIVEEQKRMLESSEWYEDVYKNDIETITRVLYGAIKEKSQERWASMINKQIFPLHGDINAACRLYKKFNPLPPILIDFPHQLDWTRQHYHLGTPQRDVAREDCIGDHRLASVSVTFLHPFEALLSVLLSFRFCFRLPPPHFVLTPRKDNSAFSTLECLYCLPLSLRRWCGTSLNDDKDQKHIRQCLPFLESSTANETTERCFTKNASIRSAKDVLCHYRLFKSPKQVVQHLWSAIATRQAFHAAMRCAATTASEHSISIAFHRAILDLSGRLGPDVRVEPAYIPVVASGVRATQIHYTCNNATGDKGDLLRLDGGVELDLVPTDCTRSFPVHQCRFSSNQKTIYQVLLGIQHKLLQTMKSGLSVSEMSKKHIELTKEALDADLGVKNVTRSQVCSLFCSHGFGHLMGLDIHEEFPVDTHLRQSERTFLGGMIHTVEPGIYLPDTDRAGACGYDIASVPHAFRGVGVQIEDEVLILPDRGHNARERAPWSRVDYLNNILSVVEEVLRDQDYVKDCVFLREDRLQHYKTELTHSQFNVLYFLFLQRSSLFGTTHAIQSLPLDALTVQSNFTEKDEKSKAVARSCEWYPFEVVLLTACIPKDISHIEACMNGYK